MRATVIFLSVLLSPGDEHWLAFGLNRLRPDEASRPRSRKAEPASEIIPLPESEPASAAAAARSTAAAA